MMYIQIPNQSCTKFKTKQKIYKMKVALWSYNMVADAGGRL